MDPATISAALAVWRLTRTTSFVCALRSGGWNTKVPLDVDAVIDCTPCVRVTIHVGELGVYARHVCTSSVCEVGYRSSVCRHRTCIWAQYVHTPRVRNARYETGNTCRQHPRGPTPLSVPACT
eukprot:2679369-Rhodomonas_salina.3